LARRYFPWGKVIFFATGNLHKYNEARRVLAEHGIAAAMLRMDTLEIQNDDIEIIAKAAALDAVRKTLLPVIVEDAGLFIDALHGFPGPYSKYVYQTLGKAGVVKLLEKHEDRKACFRSVVAFCGPETALRCFHGVVEGKIGERMRGSSGFGFDPIFEPTQEPGRTFGEMTVEEKNVISHRARALMKFAEWYKSCC
jgi:XTP/dITP diphosphohydrolase